MGRFTDEEEAEMKRLWEEDGMSASQLARYFGKGATRNVIIGIVHRRGWKLHAKPTGRTYYRHIDNFQRPPRNAMSQNIATLPSQDILALEPYGPVNDFPAVGMCRHITGDPGTTDWACCGYPTGDLSQHKQGDPARPYCEAHHQLVNVAPEPYTRVPKGRVGNPHWRARGASARLDDVMAG